MIELNGSRKCPSCWWSEKGLLKFRRIGVASFNLAKKMKTMEDHKSDFLLKAFNDTFNGEQLGDLQKVKEIGN